MAVRRWPSWGCIILLGLLLYFGYMAWIVVKNVLMDSFSDEYVLSSITEPYSAIPTVVKRHNHIVPALIRRLREDQSPEIRANAAVCCGMIGLWHQDKEKTKSDLRSLVVPALKEALRDKSLLVQVKSAHALFRIERKKEDVLTTLDQGWSSGGKNEKYAVYQAVTEMGLQASELVDVISRSFHDPDELVRRWAKDSVYYIKSNDMALPPIPLPSISRPTSSSAIDLADT